tara:strand:- start:231 stop:398 length:168 start_codon:yes stop_codon:yes gene_type:complete
MPKYTVRETYTKADVWYDVEANSKDEAIQKVRQLNEPDDEETGWDKFVEAEESEE